MASMPLSSNDLGLKNSQRGFGIALISSGVVIALFAVARYLISHQTPLDVLQWGVLASLGMFALRRIYVGTNLVLAVFSDALGPANIGDGHHTIQELLCHRRIWTYRKPSGLAGNICHRLFPAFVFLPPPYRALFDGLAFHLLAGIAAIVCTGYFGWPAAPLLGVILAAGLGRILALWSAIGGHPLERPSIEVYENPEHLVGAGNPVDLFNHVRMAFEHLREQDFQNRTLCDQSPDVGINDLTNKFESDLIVETQPTPATRQATSKTAVILDVFGVLLECTGVFLLLFGSLLIPLASLPFMWGAAAAASWFACTFYGQALGIHCTYRFRSDIMWLNLRGSYVLNKLAIGGGLTGLPSTEGHAIKSDIHAIIRGCRLITECAPTQQPTWSMLMGSVHPAEHTLQHVPRYIVSASLNSVFNERLSWILNNLVNYRDQGADLRTPDLLSNDLQALLKTNLQLTQTMNAAAAIGTVQGQQAALGQSTAPALPTPATGPLGLPSPSAAAPMSASYAFPPNNVSVPSTPVLPSSPPAQPTQPVKPAAKPVAKLTSTAPPPPPSKATNPAPTPPLAASQDKSGIQTTMRWMCQKCGRQLEAPSRFAGKSLDCSGCGQRQKIPAG